MATEHPTRSDDQSEKAPSRRRDISELYGLLKWQGPPLTLKDMQAAIAAGAVAR
jgi:hypothetical protein